MNVNMTAKERIAFRIAKEFKDGDFVNLGIGLPTLAVDYIPIDLQLNLHSENGLAGVWDAADTGLVDQTIVDAGGKPIALQNGGVFFDSATSFEIIRGGHIDITVLGALEVDETGCLANWKIPNKLIPGMGGAMDLVTGSNKVIVSMLHTNKGKPKLVKKCSLPLTGKNVVDMVITELGVFEYRNDEMFLIELSEGVSLDEIKEATPAKYHVDLN